jgi:hypothetical protein
MEVKKATAPKEKKTGDGKDKLQAGDSIDFDIEDNGQKKLFD